MNWYYGPTLTDPEPGKMWHAVCLGEVLIIDGAYICAKCDAVEVIPCEAQDLEVCTKGPYGFHWCAEQIDHEGKHKCLCGKEFGDDAPNAALHEG